MKEPFTAEQARNLSGQHDDMSEIWSFLRKSSEYGNKFCIFQSLSDLQVEALEKVGYVVTRPEKLNWFLKWFETDCLRLNEFKVRWTK